MGVFQCLSCLMYHSATCSPLLTCHKELECNWPAQIQTTTEGPNSQLLSFLVNSTDCQLWWLELGAGMRRTDSLWSWWAVRRKQLNWSTCGSGCLCGPEMGKMLKLRWKGGGVCGDMAILGQVGSLQAQGLASTRDWGGGSSWDQNIIHRGHMEGWESQRETETGTSTAFIRECYRRHCEDFCRRVKKWDCPLRGVCFLPSLSLNVCWAFGLQGPGSNHSYWKEPGARWTPRFKFS